MPGDRPPSIQSQTILAGHTVDDVWRSLGGLAAALAVARTAELVSTLDVVVGDVGPEPTLAATDVAGLEAAAGSWGFASISYRHLPAAATSVGRDAVGVHGAHGRLAVDATADLLLLLDAAAVPSPTMLAGLLDAAADPAVGIAEARLLPIEVPKPYDALTGDTSWASSSAALVRRAEVFVALAGFDADQVGDLAADVDLSWRARLAGWRVVAVPRAAAFCDVAPRPWARPSPGARHAAELARLLVQHRFGAPPPPEPVAPVRSGDDEVDAEAAAAHVARRSARAELAALVAAGRAPAAVAGTEGVAADVAADVAALGCLERRPLTADPRADAVDGAVDPSTPLDDLLARVGATRPTAGAPAAAGRPLLTVLVRTQGERMPLLRDALACLAGQTEDDVEVLVLVHGDATAVTGTTRLVELFDPRFAERVRVVPVRGGGRSRPLNVGLEQARGRFVAFLDDDDVVTADWAAAFARLARRHPGRIARSRCATRTARRLSVDDPIADHELPGELELPYAAAFDYIGHLRLNASPICSVAFPLDTLRALDLHFDESLAVVEDWDLLMRTAQYTGVVDSGAVTSIYHHWDGGDASRTLVEAAIWRETHHALLARWSESPVLLPPGTVTGLVDGTAFQDMLDEYEHLRHHLDLARQRLAQIESSEWWKLTLPPRKALGSLKLAVRRVVANRKGPGD